MRQKRMPRVMIGVTKEERVKLYFDGKELGTLYPAGISPADLGIVNVSYGRDVLKENEIRSAVALMVKALRGVDRAIPKPPTKPKVTFTTRKGKLRLCLNGKERCHLKTMSELRRVAEDPQIIGSFSIDEYQAIQGSLAAMDRILSQKIEEKKAESSDMPERIKSGWELLRYEHTQLRSPKNKSLPCGELHDRILLFSTYEAYAEAHSLLLAGKESEELFEKKVKENHARFGKPPELLNTIAEGKLLVSRQEELRIAHRVWMEYTESPSRTRVGPDDDTEIPFLEWWQGEETKEILRDEVEPEQGSPQCWKVWVGPLQVDHTECPDRFREIDKDVFSCAKHRVCSWEMCSARKRSVAQMRLDAGLQPC